MVLPRLVTRMIWRIPAARASSTAYWISGLSTTGSISLGITLVAGRKRVPRPPTGITALQMGFMKSVNMRSGSGVCTASGVVRSVFDAERRVGGAGVMPRPLLAQFHRRLVVGVDVEEMGGDHRLQHEMHHQRAEAALVHLFDADMAQRPAALAQGLDGRKPLGGHQVA